MKDMIAKITSRPPEMLPSLSYTIVCSTTDALDALYDYANRNAIVRDALIVVYDGWVDVILDNRLVIAGGFTNDSGEGSKGYTSLVNILWDLDCSIREVRCGIDVHKRLRTASLRYSDLEYLSGPQAETIGAWRDLLASGRLHTWKPEHTINRFRLHKHLREMVVGREDLSDLIFKAYRHLEHASRAKVVGHSGNLASWHTAAKGDPSDVVFSDHVLRALVAIRNHRAHNPASSPPGALELLLLDHAFRMHDGDDTDLEQQSIEQ